MALLVSSLASGLVVSRAVPPIIKFGSSRLGTFSHIRRLRMRSYEELTLF